MAEKEKKKKVSGGGIAAAIAVALLALGGGYGYSSGMFDDIIGKKDSAKEATVKDDANKGEKTETVTISIKDNEIKVGSEVVSAEDLASVLTKKATSAKFEVKDDGAIKDTYDKVIAVLDELRNKEIIKNYKVTK